MIYADMGCQGLFSDGGAFKYTSISKRMEHNNVHLLPAETLPGKPLAVPFLFVANDAFALSVNIKKPYDGHSPGSSVPVRIFNYSLSRAHRTVENMFGILSFKFSVFSKPVAPHPNKVETVVLTCIYLHNFPHTNNTSRNFYLLPGTFDLEDMENHTVIPGSWRSETEDKHGFLNLQNVPRRSLNVAQSIRNEFQEYFILTEGYIHVHKASRPLY
jgi:hypothetical protein